MAISKQKLELDSSRLSNVVPNSLWGDPVLLVEWILFKAIIEKASDIQIDSFKNESRVRICIDGHLQQIFNGPLDILDRLSVVIKNLSELESSDTHAPQDGRFSVHFRGREVDFRVCAIPNVYDRQDFSIRIIDKSGKIKKLDELGIEPEQLIMIKKALSRNCGLILVTGPTGSGKTTLMYAMLEEINRPDRKVQTIEDPVEQKLDGISQAQVNSERNLTFGTLLRSVLRTSPNVIMIGEIRDAETAKVAISAANTGHLVISTVHTNDSLSAINRLVELEVPTYLVAQSLVLVTAQRLVRTLCTRCKTEVPITPELEQHFIKNEFALEHPHPPIYKAVGCPACRQTGYKGRVAVMEMVAINGKLREKITHHASMEELQNTVSKEHFLTLYQAALIRVLQGETDLSEIDSLKSSFLQWDQLEEAQKAFQEVEEEAKFHMANEES